MREWRRRKLRGQQLEKHRGCWVNWLDPRCSYLWETLVTQITEWLEEDGTLGGWNVRRIVSADTLKLLRIIRREEKQLETQNAGPYFYHIFHCTFIIRSSKEYITYHFLQEKQEAYGYFLYWGFPHCWLSRLTGWSQQPYSHQTFSSCSMFPRWTKGGII